jgi:hypothetical protein
MKKLRRSINKSEKTKQALLTQLAQTRTEAKRLGAETQVFADLDKIETDIQSARVKRYEDFLRVERKQLELVQATLNTLKENRHKTFVDDMKASIGLFLFVGIPYIVLSKFYYLAHIPKHIPESSVCIYIITGDVLFALWVAFVVLLAIVYRYLTLTYVNPFLENAPSLKIPTRLAGGSTVLLIYQQVLFHSADLVPTLIRPNWGPAVTSAIMMVIAFLNSNSIVAVTALTTLVPLGIGVIRLVAKRWHPWSVFFPSSRSVKRQTPPIAKKAKLPPAA